MLKHIACLLLLCSCHSSDWPLYYTELPDYHASQRRKIVEHRQQYYVEFKAGDRFTNINTLYYTNIMGIRAVTADPEGEVLQIIPAGSDFKICSVKADFSISANLVVPFFEVEGLQRKNVLVTCFHQLESKAPKGYYGGYYYDRKNFRKCY